MSIKMLEQESSFRAAVPVWIRGAETEENINCGFYAAVPKCESGAVVRIAAASLYQLYINGRFVCFGPVRTAHGYHRMDAIEIGDLLDQEVNHIAIEVRNPYAYSFSLVKAPAFIQAEVEIGDAVVAATSPETADFTAIRLNQHIRKIQRYSFQRPFAESYRLSPRDHLWRIGDLRYVSPEVIAQTADKKLLPRGLPIHQYPFAPAASIVAGGKAETGVNPILNSIRGEYDEELEVYLTDEVQTFRYTPAAISGTLPRQLSQGDYIVLDTKVEKSGLICAKFTCTEPTVLWLLWDELLIDGVTKPARLDAASIMYLEMEPGTYDFQTFDIYSLKYLQMVCTSGSVMVHSAGIREYRYPLPTVLSSGCSDPVHQKIWHAAWETFCQNASDIFMDCPHRERAGWLCDSFFIGRVEYALTGECRMERLFLENFLLPESFAFHPKGMLPMCYPSDHSNGNYIPNWAMWYVLEVADHVKRTGDRSLADAAKERIYELIRFFRRYVNEFGLLERLERWVFVEWSKANDFVQDVNFPTNMLYSGMLRAAGTLYGDAALTQQADAICKTIREMAYDGEFFIDNALRGEDGKLHLTNNRTETCQYYAFFFDIATPVLHSELWHKLTTDFGPHRTKLGLWPEIHPSNAFIGNYLRLDQLVRYGLGQQTLEEMKGYFEYMADTTGTLWEHNDTQASCNHGFASYYIYLLKQILN